MERNGLRYEHFCFENCLKLPRKKNIFFIFFTFEVPFYDLFAPTSWNRMSNIFRDSESLGKSNGKKWSQIWTFSFENCLKLPQKKKVFFFNFFGFLRFLGFFPGLFAPTSPSQMSNIFRDSESLGKINDKKWSQIWTCLFENWQKSPHKKKSFFSHFFHFWGTVWRSFLPHLPKLDVQYF